MGRLRDAFVALEEMYVATVADRDRYRTALREILSVYEDSDLTNAAAQDQTAAIARGALDG